MAGVLYARVLWFHAYEIDGPGDHPDVDNVVKLLLDAVCGIAYRDDQQIVRLAGSRHRMGDCDLADLASVPTWMQDMIDSLSMSDDRDFVYLAVGPTALSPACFGPVDGVGE